MTFPTAVPAALMMAPVCGSTVTEPSPNDAERPPRLQNGIGVAQHDALSPGIHQDQSPAACRAVGNLFVAHKAVRTAAGRIGPDLVRGSACLEGAGLWCTRRTTAMSVLQTSLLGFLYCVAARDASQTLTAEAAMACSIMRALLQTRI